MLMFIAKKLFKAGRKIMKRELAELLEKEIERMKDEDRDEPTKVERRRTQSVTEIMPPANNTEFYRLVVVVIIAIIIVKLF